MTMMNQMKDLYKMQKDAKQMQKELEQTQIRAADYGAVVVMSGKLEVTEIHFDDDFDFSNTAETERILKELFNRAMKKTQEYMQEKMQPMMQQLQSMGLTG
ncbi:YbaB/EbfC family nucleoid-associated protein [Candidatus Peribacteria bacterium]|nr:YbaB/EbfC family nucleoid-associated protein [Candidatus Peribacteria bacterium]